MHQSNCLVLECTMQLPERLEHIRGGRFTYNNWDCGYTSDQYTMIRIVPKTGSDCFIWVLTISGGTEKEKMWCRVYCTSECNGWLSKSGGPTANQVWYVGEYPSATQYVPMRFVDATIGATQEVDAVTNKPLTDVIAKLTQCFLEFRQETQTNAKTMKDREIAIFKASE